MIEKMKEANANWKNQSTNMAVCYSPPSMGRLRLYRNNYLAAASHKYRSIKSLRCQKIDVSSQFRATERNPIQIGNAIGCENSNQWEGQWLITFQYLNCPPCNVAYGYLIVLKIASRHSFFS